MTGVLDQTRGTMDGTSLRRALTQLLLPAMESLGEEKLAEINRYTPVDKGELLASEKGGTEVTAEGIRTWWAATAPHAAYVEFGTVNMPAQSFVRRAILPLANMQILAGRLRLNTSRPSLAFGE